MTSEKPTINNFWNTDVTPESFGPDNYKNSLLEQYKLFAETADRVTERRNQMNQFFIALNTLLIGVFGLFVDPKQPPTNIRNIIVTLVIALALCGVWVILLISYRKLNKAKYEIITEEYEKKLPSKPFKSEWDYCKQIKRPEFTLIETLIPIFFAIMYAVNLFFIFT